MTITGCEHAWRCNDSKLISIRFSAGWQGFSSLLSQAPDLINSEFTLDLARSTFETLQSPGIRGLQFPAFVEALQRLAALRYPAEEAGVAYAHFLALHILKVSVISADGSSTHAHTAPSITASKAEEALTSVERATAAEESELQVRPATAHPPLAARIVKHSHSALALHSAFHVLQERLRTSGWLRKKGGGKAPGAPHT